MGPGYTISLDRLPLKRIHALEETGTEILPPESTSEEKPLALLGRIDFDQFSAEEKGATKAKADKETATQSGQVWPWEEFVGHLQQAREELSVMLDLIKHVEENQAVTVASIYRQKPLPGKELCSEVALRLSSKVGHFQETAKYFKKTAKDLDEQVEREALFYGALMRVQRNWKVKRQRGISAGPGGSAGFSVDLSYPPSGDGVPASSPRVAALCTPTVDQDSSGMLVVHPLHGQAINWLHVDVRTGVLRTSQMPNLGRRKVPPETAERSHQRASLDVDVKVDHEGAVIAGVDKGARCAQSVLRRIQGAIFDELVFDCISREALLPSATTNIVGIGDTSLQLSLGNGAALVLELFEDNEPHRGTSTDKAQEQLVGHLDTDGVWQPQENTSSEGHWRNLSPSSGHYPLGFEICLKQVVHQAVLGKRAGNGTHDVPLTKAQDAGKVREAASTAATGAIKDVGPEMVPTVLRKISAATRHRVSSLKVSSLLEKQVHGVPHLYLQFHPTWHPRVSAWDLSLYMPEAAAQTAQGGDWANRKTDGRLMFECTIVLRDECITVEGLEDMSPLDDVGKGSLREVMSTTKHTCTLTELRAFLLYQVAAQLVMWLYEEALGMGVQVSRDLLCIKFVTETYGDLEIVACPDVRNQCVNWLLRTLGSPTEDSDSNANGLSQIQRYLGSLTAESLRSLIVQLISPPAEQSEEP